MSTTLMVVTIGMYCVGIGAHIIPTVKVVNNAHRNKDLKYGVLLRGKCTPLIFLAIVTCIMWPVVHMFGKK